jgi:hypothetical protein
MTKKILIGLISLSILIGVLYISSNLVIKLLLTEQIKNNGFPNSYIGNVQLLPHGLIIDSVTLDGEGFSTLQGVTIGFDWVSLLQTRSVKTVNVKSVEIMGELDNSGQIKIAGWDATLPSTNPQQSLLPISEILIQGATFDVETSYGNIRLEGKFSLNTPNTDKQVIQFAIWGQQHQLSFDAKGSGEINSNGDYNINTEIQDGRIKLPFIDTSRASGILSISKKADETSPIYSGKILAGKANIGDKLFQNLQVNLDTKNSTPLSITVSPAGYSDVVVSGMWVGYNNPLLEMSIISENTKDVLAFLSLENQDTFTKELASIKPFKLSLSTPIINLQKDKKSTTYNLSLGDNRAKNFLFSSGSLNWGTDIKSLVIKSDTLELGMAQGVIIFSPLEWMPLQDNPKDVDVTMTVKDIDMHEVSKIFEIDGLSAKGKLSGSIPITLSPKGILISNASIKSQANGSFSYTPATPPAALQGDDDRMVLVREALKDFQFTVLELDISGDVNQTLKTTLKADGTTPSMGDRLIKLNINLEGNIGDIIQHNINMGKIGDEIRSILLKEE